MEIDNVNFWGHLPTILDAIADAEFISLSLIGIPDPIAKRNRSKEELYRELVEHSKTYHVSKIGLTCFQYEEDKKGTCDGHPSLDCLKDVADTANRRILCS